MKYIKILFLVTAVALAAGGFMGNLPSITAGLGWTVAALFYLSEIINEWSSKRE